MRPPVLILLGLGGGPFLPVPLFLLWPFVGVAWLALLTAEQLIPAHRASRSWLELARRSFRVFANLPGLHVDVESRDGTGINIWFV